MRTAVLASEIASPTGLASSGAAEDYTLTIFDPRIRIAKTTLGGVGGPFGFAAATLRGSPRR